MFTNNQRQEERTGKYGTPRVQYLQGLVTQFQNASSEETKERIAANLANFAYDPYNYTFLRQLNVLELYLDCITEPNEKLIEFGIGGICNSCADPANAVVIAQCNGIPLIIKCLSSPVRNTFCVHSLKHHPEETIKQRIEKVSARITQKACGQTSYTSGTLASMAITIKTSVNYAIAALYYMCDDSNREDVLKPEVVDVFKRYAAASSVSVIFSNLAQAFLDKHVP